jgi:hypothetical protein
VSVAAYFWERRRERTGLIAAMGLAIALVQAFAGYLAGSAKWYFVPPVIVNAVYGMAFLVSVLIGRPLAGTFASETYAFPPQVRPPRPFAASSRECRWRGPRTCWRGARSDSLRSLTVEGVIVVNLLTGIPFTAALMAWSVWYGVRGFRQSEEWGAYLRGAP